MRSFTCPHCSGHIGFEVADVGQTGMCPHCGKSAKVMEAREIWSGQPPEGGTPTLKLRRRRLLTRTLAVAGCVTFLAGIWAGSPGRAERFWRSEAHKYSHEASVAMEQPSFAWDKVAFHAAMEVSRTNDFRADICAEISRRLKWKFWYVAASLGLLTLLIKLKDWAW